MSKFTGPADGNYHAVRDEILKMIGLPNGRLIAHSMWAHSITDALLGSRGHRNQAEYRWSEEDSTQRDSPYFGGSNFSGNNSGSRINQVGTVTGDFRTG